NVVRGAEDGRLPENQCGGRVDPARVPHETGCLVALTPGGPWIDSQVGEEAILGRDGGKHSRRESLHPGAANGFVRRSRIDAWVPVQAQTTLAPPPKPQ